MKKYTLYPLSIKGPYRLYALEVVSGLYKIKRTGWVDRGVNNPETVGEHTDELIKLAKKLYPYCPGLIKMLKIHDWIEFIKFVGDMRTDQYCPPDHRRTPEEKKALELKGIKQICSNLGPFGNSIFKLWMEYEEGKTLRAKIANQLDKLQVNLRAIEYQLSGEPVIAYEFIELNRHLITIPILKLMLEEAETKLIKFLNSKTN